MKFYVSSPCCGFYFVLVTERLDEYPGGHFHAAISFTVGVITEDVVKSPVELTIPKIEKKE